MAYPLFDALDNDKEFAADLSSMQDDAMAARLADLVDLEAAEDQAAWDAYDRLVADMQRDMGN